MKTLGRTTLRHAATSRCSGDRRRVWRSVGLMGGLVALVIAAAPCDTVTAQDLDSLSFLVGHWRGEAFGGVIEEIWLPAEGDVMHAVFRAVSGGTMAFSEFIQVTRDDGGVFMRFAHFRTDYSTWEGDGPPMTLRLTRVGADRAVFEGEDDSSPDQIVYTVDDTGALIVEVSGLDAPLRFTRARESRP